MRKIFIIPLFLVIEINIVAQGQNNQVWNITFHLNSGYSLTTSDWEYTHPYYLGSGGSFTGRINGTYEENYNFSCGLEFSRSYFGYQVNLGIFPAKFLIKEQIDPGVRQVRNDVYSYNSIFLEAEGILFPLGNPCDKVIPFLKVGLGGMRTTGDIKNNLLSLSGSAGTKIFIAYNFGVDLNIKFRYMLLYNVTLANEISAAYGVSLSSLCANIGIIYQF
jgi:hypothetical protein